MPAIKSSADLRNNYNEISKNKIYKSVIDE